MYIILIISAIYLLSLITHILMIKYSNKVRDKFEIDTKGWEDDDISLFFLTMFPLINTFSLIAYIEIVFQPYKKLTNWICKK